jgi:hypothetical protein
MSKHLILHDEKSPAIAQEQAPGTNHEPNTNTEHESPVLNTNKAPVPKQGGDSEVVVVLRWAVSAGAVGGNGAEFAEGSVVAVGGPLADKMGTKTIHFN